MSFVHEDVAKKLNEKLAFYGGGFSKSMQVIEEELTEASKILEYGSLKPEQVKYWSEYIECLKGLKPYFKDFK